MTGRHVTIRADGDSVANAAFGGPIVYGHGAGDSQEGPARQRLLLPDPEGQRGLQGPRRQAAREGPAAQGPEGRRRRRPGRARARSPASPSASCRRDQKGLVESVIKVILAPYREEDVNEALAILKDGGGLDALHMAFYESDDIGKDQEWDIWRLEGPNFVWHFRGAPHVHAYVNIAKKA